MGREITDAPVQVAQLSMPNWGNLVDSAKAAGSSALDKAKKAVANAPELANEGIEKAKHLNTKHNQDVLKDVGQGALEGAAMGGHVGLIAGAGKKIAEHATGRKIDMPLGLGDVKTTIAKKVIEGATGHEVPDPTHLKQRAVQEALNRATNHDGNTEHMRLTPSAPIAPQSDGSSVSKAKDFASGLIGKAHNILPSMTIDGHDNPTKK